VSAKDLPDITKTLDADHKVMEDIIRDSNLTHREFLSTLAAYFGHEASKRMEAAVTKNAVDHAEWRQAQLWLAPVAALQELYETLYGEW
jgi:hypothetical protein